MCFVCELISKKTMIRLQKKKPCHAVGQHKYIMEKGLTWVHPQISFEISKNIVRRQSIILTTEKLTNERTNKHEIITVIIVIITLKKNVEFLI